MRGSVAREGKAEGTSTVMQRTNPTLKRLLAVFEFPSFAKVNRLQSNRLHRRHGQNSSIHRKPQLYLSV